jgi:hypothetical protein
MLDARSHMERKTIPDLEVRKTGDVAGVGASERILVPREPSRTRLFLTDASDGSYRLPRIIGNSKSPIGNSSWPGAAIPSGPWPNEDSGF